MVMVISLRRLLLVPLLLVLLLVGHSSAPGSVEFVNQTCEYNQYVENILEQATMESWLGWIEKLTGVEPVYELGFNTRIQTRLTSQMFSGQSNARAYDYVSYLVETWYPPEYVEDHQYNYLGAAAKNLVLTIPGVSLPSEYVLLVAHLDSTSRNSALAPGANDNATGSAALLEAARLFRHFRFERTVQLVWFTGEESGLIGSRAFVNDYSYRDYHAVINLDMFGWDGDGDRCFELHVGELSSSEPIGRCVVDTIQAYGLELEYDFLIENAITLSDHASFWEWDVGAIAVVENWGDQKQPEGCSGVDRNPHYHTARDTIAENLTPAFGFDITRASLGAVAALAVPDSICFDSAPFLTLVEETPTSIRLSWDPVSGADAYRIYRSSYGCSEGWETLGETVGLSWTEGELREDWPYQYRVEAVSKLGYCSSFPSACKSFGPETPPRLSIFYLPFFSRNLE
jgi:hypothetical protein